MNKTLLQQLYNGEIYPAANIKCDTVECLKLHHEINNEQEYFKMTLSSQDWSRFERLGDLKIESSSAYVFANFTYGFRLGVQLMIEALAGGELAHKEP